MVQWLLVATPYGTVELHDPDGSVVATYNVHDPISALVEHLQDGDQLSYSTQ